MNATTPVVVDSDAWIAAAALQLNAHLATHHAGDYAGVEDLVILTAAPTL